MMPSGKLGWAGQFALVLNGPDKSPWISVSLFVVYFPTVIFFLLAAVSEPVSEA